MPSVIEGFYPEAVPPEEGYFYPSATGHAFKAVLVQDEVRMDKYNLEMQAVLNTLLEQHEQSIVRHTADYGHEFGCLCFVTPRGLHVEYVSSGSKSNISDKDIDTAFERCAQAVGSPQDIIRAQLYHTHSRTMQWSLSRMDVDETYRLKEKVSKLVGKNVPFDMHALPLDLSKDGCRVTYTKPTIDRPSVKEKLHFSPRLRRITL